MATFRQIGTHPIDIHVHTAADLNFDTIDQQLTPLGTTQTWHQGATCMISQQTETHGYVHTSHIDLINTPDLHLNKHPGVHA